METSSSGAPHQREVLSLNGWWHVWYDDAADWRTEPLPPPGAPPETVPPHPPSAGWEGMEEGMESQRVPGTWEQSRPGFHGVAWYWRPVVIPDHWQGRAIRLHFVGVNSRAQVYLDQALVGYHLDGVTPFELDLTPLVRAGRRHSLAIRVAHPGGLQLAPSRDVGGIWGDVSLVGSSSPFLQSLEALPAPDLHSVTLRCEIGHAGKPEPADLALCMRDPQGQVVAQETLRLEPARPGQLVSAHLSIPAPQLWSLSTPRLYVAKARLRGRNGADALQIEFGLRRFSLQSGRLALNGEPVYLRAARAHGWYLEGSACAPEHLAEGEVALAREMGLNALLAHGHPLHPALLEQADRQGVLVAQWLGFLPQGDGTEGASLNLSTHLARARALYRRDRQHACIVCWRAADLGKGSPAMPADPSRLLRSLCEENGDLLVSEPSDGGGERIAQADLAQSATLRPLFPSRQPSGLPDLATLLRHDRDRRLPGSAAATYGAWLAALARGFQEQRLERTFSDLAAFGAATQSQAGQAIGQSLADAGRRLGEGGLLIGDWDSPEPCELTGLVAPCRQPQVDPAEIVRALALRAAGESPSARASAGARLDAARILLWDPARRLVGVEMQTVTDEHLDASSPRLLAIPDGNWDRLTTLVAGLVAGGGRLALLADSLPREASPLLRLIGAQDAVGRELETLPLTGQMVHLYGHQDPLLDGVASPGVWGADQRQMMPQVALTGVPGIAGVCAFPSGRGTGRLPRMGSTLAIIALGQLELLLCTLPLVSGIRARWPLATRLLGNVLRWLRG